MLDDIKVANTLHVDIEQAEYGAEIEQEESKIASDRAAKKIAKQVPPKLQPPYALIEGPEPS